MFSTTTVPIVTFLLSNWQPTLSLACGTCFITMGWAQPLIMHGNMLVKKKKVWFSFVGNSCFRAFSEGCGSCGVHTVCFRLLSPILREIFRLLVADIQSIHITDRRVEVSFPAAPLHFHIYHLSESLAICHKPLTYKWKIYTKVHGSIWLNLRRPIAPWW